jgi:hypothetical protein
MFSNLRPFDPIRKNSSAECLLQYVDVLICRHITLERKVLWQNEGTARGRSTTGTQIESGWEVLLLAQANEKYSMARRAKKYKRN